MDGWIDGWMDGWKDILIFVQVDSDGGNVLNYFFFHVLVFNIYLIS